MKLAVGNSDFKDVRIRSCDFIDKTLFIRDVLQDETMAFLITRPRRFGKTFNLSMLRYFFDIRDAKENKALFEDTLIGQATLDNEVSCMDYQGKFPVLFITLKNVRSTNYEGMNTAIASVISELYKEHRYLLKTKMDILETDEKSIYQLIIERKAEIDDLQCAFKKLTEYLYRFHNKKVIVLMDEYDTPMHSAFEARKPYHAKLIEFMREFMSVTFKDNEYLQKGIITGILRVSLMNMFSGANSIPVRTMLSHHFAPYFGFTEREVEELFSKSGRAQEMGAIKKWYNGYEVGGVTLYNPWSIVRCIDERWTLQSYWLESGEHGTLGKALLSLLNTTVFQQLQALIEDQSIEIEMDERTIFANIEKNERALWSLMFYAGYLKAVNFRMVEEKKLVTLKIPNFEVKGAFKNIVENWGRIPENNESLYEVLVTSLSTGDISQFQRIVKRYIEETISFYDFEYDTEERFYHIFLLGMMVTLRDRFIIDSNKEAGKGRFDIILIPKLASQPGVVLELKSVHVRSKRKRDELEADQQKRTTLLNETAEGALDQIEKQRYQARFTQHGIRQAIHIGMSFLGKEVTVNHKTVTYSPELRPVSLAVANHTGMTMFDTVIGAKQYQEVRDDNLLPPLKRIKNIDAETEQHQPTSPKGPL